MNNTFRNKYRIASARLQHWDYATAAAYFITICTKEKASYFGEITNHKMTLSNAGIIADMLWFEIKNHTQNVELGAYVVMPNHIHGILILNGMGSDESQKEHVETLHATSLPGVPIPPSGVPIPTSGVPIPPSGVPIPPSGVLIPPSGVPIPPSGVPIPPPIIQTPPPLSPPPPPIEKNEFMSSISPKSNSLSTIIRSYKSAVTKHCNRLDLEFGWQTRFYDHIIRDAKSFENIEHYIENNIKNWKEDGFYEKL